MLRKRYGNVFSTPGLFTLRAIEEDLLAYRIGEKVIIDPMVLAMDFEDLQEMIIEIGFATEDELKDIETLLKNTDPYGFYVLHAESLTDFANYNGGF